jgi:hypothetical protein
MRRFSLILLAALLFTNGGCQFMERVTNNVAADYDHVTNGSPSEYIRSGGKTR